MREQRVALEDEADVAVARRQVRDIAAVQANRGRTADATKPAMVRSSEVLPQPDGPSNATNSPRGDDQVNALQRGERAI